MTSRHAPIKGILWMLSSCIFAAIMISIVRHTSTIVEVYQIVLFRNIFALLCFLPWILVLRGEAFRTTRLKLYGLRAFMGICAMFLWFYAIALIPLAIAVSLSFAVPLLVALLSVLFLKERYGPHRWTALLLGFIGTLVVLRPWEHGFNPHILLVLGATIFWALSSFAIKQLTNTDSSTKISFYSVLMMTPLSVPPALLYWQPVPAEIWGWLILLGVTANLFQYSLNESFAQAPFAVVLPFDFTRLIFVSIIAYVAFGEVMDGWTLAGGTIIMGSAAYAAYRTRKDEQRRHAKTARHDADDLPAG